jgi:transposase
MHCQKPKKNLASQIEFLKDRRIFFMDEARFGTHSKIGHGWFPTGSRSRIKIKLGFKNFYIYAAVEPSSGEVFSLMLPKVNTELMNLFLEKMAERYQGEKIALVMDGAGWHKSKKLITPKNIAILHLPPYSPELNPVERLWLHIKSNTIRNKIYDSLDELENVICNFIKDITCSTAAQVCSVNWFN